MRKVPKIYRHQGAWRYDKSTNSHLNGKAYDYCWRMNMFGSTRACHW